MSSQLAATLSLGPGQHGPILVEQLGQKKCLRRVIRSWPEFEVVELGGDGEVDSVLRHSWFSSLVRLTWACWRRLPVVGVSQIPQSLIFHLFDHVASRLTGDGNVFHGWSGQCLRSLRAARRREMVTFIENPFAHVEFYQEILREEEERCGIRTHSRFPEPTVRRILSEIEETDHIVVPSTFAERTFLERGVPVEKLVRIPFGVDTTRFSPSRTTPDCFRIVFAGRLELQKGVHYLLQAFSELALPGAELWLVGHVHSEMKPYLARYEGHYRLLQHTPHAELAGIFREASAVALLSIQDGFGLVLTEAMACGVPIIASENTGGPDLIRDGVEGHIVPIRDVEAAKDRIDRLYHDETHRRDLGRAARERVVREFTWDRYGERLLASYEKALQTRARRAHEAGSDV